MAFKLGRNGAKSASHIGHLIDVVTDGNTQTSENWAMYMEICDLINSTEDGPKEAVKSFRKRFATKHPSTINLALLLLETCVKNCGKRFHLQIATKDFLQDFIKIISPKYNPSVELQMTVLGLLQTWSYAFQTSPDLKEVCKTYNELKMKGVEFPPLDADKASQAFIPAQSAPTVAVTEVPVPRSGKTYCSLSPTGQQSMQRVQPGGHRPQQTVPAGAGLTQDHMSKLKTELNTVQQNCHVFGDMLTELSHGQGNSSDIDLLEDLNTTCRQMQKRILELIQAIQIDEVTEELLSMNDDLNNVFLRYDRYQRLRSGQPGQNQPPSTDEPGMNVYSPPPVYSTMPQPPKAVSQTDQRSPGFGQPSGGAVAIDNLIDFGDTSPAAVPSIYQDVDTNMAQLQLHGGGGGSGDDFDMFMQSRNTNNTMPVAEANPWLPTNNQIEEPIYEVIKETGAVDQDFLEMEKWLSENPTATSETATSSEFDRFLSERAQAADSLPPVQSSAARGGH